MRDSKDISELRRKLQKIIDASDKRQVAITYSYSVCMGLLSKVDASKAYVTNNGSGNTVSLDQIKGVHDKKEFFHRLVQYYKDMVQAGSDDVIPNASHSEMFRYGLQVYNEGKLKVPDLLEDIGLDEGEELTMEMTTDVTAGMRIGTLRRRLHDAKKDGSIVELVVAHDGELSAGKLVSVTFEDIVLSTKKGDKAISVNSVTGVHDMSAFWDEAKYYARRSNITGSNERLLGYALDAYSRGKLSVLDCTTGKRISGTPSAKEYTAEAIKWCRDNAPSACTDSTDDELWDLMKPIYYANRNRGAAGTINRDITYKELLQEMPADIVTFRCPLDAEFVVSLENDGYREHLFTRSTEQVDKWMNKKEHALDESAPTSVASWNIYVESKDCYYDISITNEGDYYEVEIARQCTRMELKMV